jgi:hypothetical protein
MAESTQLRSKVPRRRRILRWTAGIVLLCAAVAAGSAFYLWHHAEPLLRARIVAELQERFHARVELDGFHLSLKDGISVEGRGLRIWPPAQVGGVRVAAGENAGKKPAAGALAGQGAATGATAVAIPPQLPLIRLQEFRFHAPLHYEPGKPLHITRVELKGLEIVLPPKSHFSHGVALPENPAKTSSFQVDAVECTDARLILQTDKPGKDPMEFAIRSLRLSDLTTASALHFEADLTTPRPAGKLLIQGSFGPWKTLDPGESALAGDYSLQQADLGSFKEIGGRLDSTGKFQGTLRDLEVNGKADTADFQLSAFGHPLPLHTVFHALVDGTNGDTRLEAVDATLGHSHFTTQGTILQVRAADGSKANQGHAIELRVNVDRGRIEDFIRLASHEQEPLLTGALVTRSSLQIPPGAAPVHRRMRIEGAFQLSAARFSNEKIQKGIEQLSQRGQGHPEAAKSADPEQALSSMQSDFSMNNGVLTLPNLVYAVPGAQIQLHGSYGLDGGALNFAGTAKLQASVSQMVGGWKGALLKPFDGLFRKSGAGTQIPLHIRGTRANPEFGVDFAGREFDLPGVGKKKAK